MDQMRLDSGWFGNEGAHVALLGRSGPRPHFLLPLGRRDETQRQHAAVPEDRRHALLSDLMPDFRR